MTAFEYSCKIEGNHKRELRDWEHTRFLGWIMQCMWSSEPEKDFNNFFSMSKDDIKQRLTDDEMAAIVEKHINQANGN